MFFFKSGLEANAVWLAAICLQSSAFEIFWTHGRENARPTANFVPSQPTEPILFSLHGLARKMTSYFERAVFPKPQRSSGNQSSDFRSTWTKQVAVNLRHVQICSILNTISRLKTIQRFQSSNTTHDTHRISSDTWCFANANSTICFNSEQIRSDANKRSILGSLGSRIKLFWHVLDAWRAGTTSRQQLLWISWISSHIRGLGVPRYPLSDG
jgi:hypothetical protein